MRRILAVMVLANLVAQGAYAQNVNSGWNIGGSTISGFSGTSGDPLYQENRAPGQFIPGYPVTNHPSISDAGAPRGPAPAVPGYVPPPSEPFKYFTRLMAAADVSPPMRNDRAVVGFGWIRSGVMAFL
jgi:hypothetical protein